MRPVTPQPPVVDNRSGYGAGGYRAFLIMLILIGLCIMGLCYGFIRLSQTISKISENSGRNISGPDSQIYKNYKNYYPGVIGMLRIRRSSQHVGTWYMDGIQDSTNK